MNRRRVVITGRGVVSSLGNTPSGLYENLRSGVSGIRRMTEWSGENSAPLCAPVVLPSGTEKSIPRVWRRSMGRIGIFAALAARSAVEEAALSAEEVSGGRCGCVIGSTMGGSNSISEAYRLMFNGRRDEMSAL